MSILLNTKIVLLIIQLVFVVLYFVPAAAFTAEPPDSSLKTELLWPVNAIPALTSSFCEFRARHFHAGIDVKTYGQIGVPCVAVAAGRVTRIKVTPGGYGKAVYLDIGDGRVAVYAHLDRFAPLLTDILHREQEMTAKYSQDIFLEGDQAPLFQPGEIIAYSGRSGTVHPHLHYELRKGWDRTLNPLTNGYAAEDTIPPTPTDLAVTPLDAFSTVENDCQPRLYERLMRHQDGIWRVGEPIGIYGRVGLSLDAYDRANGAENQLSAYRFELFISGQGRWVTQYDEFNYNDTRQIEVERDYRLWRCQKGAYHRLYRVPGNRLDKMVFGDGVITGQDSTDFPIQVRIRVSDAADNQSIVELTFASDRKEDEMRAIVGRPLWSSNGNSRWGTIEVTLLDGFLRLSASPGVAGFRINHNWHLDLITRSVEGLVVGAWKPPADFDGKLNILAVNKNGDIAASVEQKLFPLFPDRMNTAASADGKMTINIPPQAVYDTTYISITPISNYDVKDWIQSVYKVEPLDQPLAAAVNISIKAPSENSPEGWGLYYYNPRKGWIFLDNEDHQGWISASTASWERFGLVRDLDKPRIRIQRPLPGQLIAANQLRIESSVTDSTSGIIAEGLAMKLDGKVLPAEWDAPMRRFIFHPWWNIPPGKHNLEITAVDRVGNRSVQSVAFQVRPY